MKKKDIKLIGVILEIDGKKQEFDKFELYGWECSSDDGYIIDRGVDLTVKINGKDYKIDAISKY